MYASYKKIKSHESKHSFPTFYISLPKIQSFRFNNKKNSKTESVLLIDNTNDLIRKILSEQLQNKIIKLIMLVIIYFYFKVAQNLVAEH